MTEHTPTPWSLGSHNLRAVTKDAEGIADGYDAYMVAVASSHSLVGQAEAIANAAFIVKAVNNHDVMVAELQRLFEMYGHQATADVLSRVKGAPKP
jgi:hypothetical protein